MKRLLFLLFLLPVLSYGQTPATINELLVRIQSQIRAVPPNNLKIASVMDSTVKSFVPLKLDRNTTIDGSNTHALTFQNGAVYFQDGVNSGQFYDLGSGFFFNTNSNVTFDITGGGLIKFPSGSYAGIGNQLIISNNAGDFTTSSAGLTGSTNDVLTLQSDGSVDWAAPSGGGTWGSITGTLSDQTDLQTALDGKQPLSTNLTTLAGLGTALQVPRTNATADGIEWNTPLLYPLTTTGDIWYSSDNFGEPERLGIGSTGDVLTVSSAGIPEWSSVSPGWQVSGTTNISAPVTIALAGNTLAYTSTMGFNPSQTLQSLANNGNNLWSITTGGVPKWNLYNTSGSKIGAATITALSGVSGLRLFNGAETSFYDFGFLASNNSMYLTAGTLSNTKLRIGSSAAGTATLQVTGANQIGSANARFEDSAGNAIWELLNWGTSVFNQRAQSSSNTMLSFNQAAHTGGVPQFMKMTAGASTGITNGSSVDEITFDLSRTIAWAGNNPITSYNGIYIDAPTLTSSSSGATITTASTLTIASAPVDGTNMTTTDKYALNVLSGNSYFGGDIETTLTGSSSGVVVAGTGGVLARGVDSEYKNEVVSVDASFTTLSTVLLSGVIPNDAVYLIEVSGTGIELTGANSYSYNIKSTVKNDGGTLSIVGTNDPPSIKSEVSTTVTITIVGNEIQLDVTTGLSAPAKNNYRVKILSKID